MAENLWLSNPVSQEVKQAELVWRCSSRCSRSDSLSIQYIFVATSCSHLISSSQILVPYVEQEVGHCDPGGSHQDNLSRAGGQRSILSALYVQSSKCKIQNKPEVENNTGFSHPWQGMSLPILLLGLHIRLPKVALEIFKNPERPEKLASNLSRPKKTLTGYVLMSWDILFNCEPKKPGMGKHDIQRWHLLQLEYENMWWKFKILLFLVILHLWA